VHVLRQNCRAAGWRWDTKNSSLFVLWEVRLQTDFTLDSCIFDRRKTAKNLRKSWTEGRGQRVGVWGPRLQGVSARSWQFWASASECKVLRVLGFGDECRVLAVLSFRGRVAGSSWSCGSGGFIGLVPKTCGFYFCAVITCLFLIASLGMFLRRIS
jgi:hypothetical protein